MTAKWAGRPGEGRTYVLRDPRNDLIRYVGATTVSLASRLKGHVAATRPDAYGDLRTAPVTRWVAELLDEGLQPSIEELEIVDRARLAAVERGQISAHHRDGWPLLNVRDLPPDDIDTLTRRVERLSQTGGDLLEASQSALAQLRADREHWERIRAADEALDPSDPNLFESAARLWIDAWDLRAGDSRFLEPLSDEQRELALIAMVEIGTVAHRHGVRFSRVAHAVGLTHGMGYWNPLQTRVA